MNRLWILLVLAALTAAVQAEQMQKFPGGFEAHYVVVASKFIDPAVSERLGITRGATQALVNLSVLQNGQPVSAPITGTATNLIGTERQLDFREVREGTAIYAIAVLRHSHEEHWRFNLAINLPGQDQPAMLTFKQQLFAQR